MYILVHLVYISLIYYFHFLRNNQLKQSLIGVISILFSSILVDFFFYNPRSGIGINPQENMDLFESVN